MTPSRGKRPPVISDVAACAGVSVSTVSRYLNGSSHLSPESAEKIARAIELLGYRPNLVARGLKRSSMQTIAVLSTNTTLLGSAVTIQGIEDEARARGYSVMISKLDQTSPAEVQKVVDTVVALNPSGVIVLKYDATAQRALHMLSADLPTVTIGGAAEEARDQVSLCEREGGQVMTEYLLSLGHATVHHIGVPVRSEGTSRTDGWEAALHARDLAVPPPLICGWEPSAARLLGRELAAREDVSAVFAGNDELAMGLIRGLREAGRPVPGSVSVVGFDDHPLADIWEPGLTTYRQDFAAAGRAAVELMVSRVEGRQKSEELAPRLREIRGVLVARESAQAPSSAATP
ncbi:LacI family DNA-binding transcriptional regulator [Schaalia sp. Marseille-Q2122]|uniref:LacI family DNA-binding transcriptional regulator n=1 Tax=Schaalia sp. Marseille-Q2122 TaxID=2736604 RepID=UPI00158C1FB5|nr:LacI family DNA-binding transcriptional regulator [Schaalia sp. Marseille-Q2122]